MTHQKIQLIELALTDLTEAVRQIIKQELHSISQTKLNANEDTLLTRKEASGFLGVSLPTLSKLVKDGHVQAFHLGGKIMFKKSDVDEALKPIQVRKFNRNSI